MSKTPGATLTYRLYAALANCAAPFAYRNVAKKLALADIGKTRQRERLGYASVERPEGRLIWCHAASVGESLSAITLIRRLQDDHPDARFLLTSGTATSSQIAMKQLPEGAIHQFVPLDASWAIERFLDHWQPDMAIFVESELWPQMLVRSARAGVPLALLNARLSAGSLRGWGKFPKTARFILSQFSMIRTQDDATLEGLLGLGADSNTTDKGQNLKSAAGPLHFSDDDLAKLRTQIGDRPLWCAASTHPGEEDAILQAHKSLLMQHPDLLLILVPRHPERRGDVVQLIDDAGLTCGARSDGASLDHQVYLADTMGEMGLWYALANAVFVGGSFVDVGGHNPFEPAHQGAVVLHGPLYANFAEAYAAFKTAGGQIEVANAKALTDALAKLLADQDSWTQQSAQAQAFAADQMQGLEQLATDLSDVLKAV